MARAPKRTITRDSVFKTTSHTAAETPAQGVAAAESATRQTALWLADDEVDWLDNQCRDIRRGGWRSVTRSALVRALIQAAREHAVDLTGATGEHELAQRLSTR
jgi:hypothetical protein